MVNIKVSVGLKAVLSEKARRQDKQIEDINVGRVNHSLFEKNLCVSPKDIENLSPSFSA